MCWYTCLTISIGQVMKLALDIMFRDLGALDTRHLKLGDL